MGKHVIFLWNWNNGILGIEDLNLDVKAVREKRKLQIQELKEMRLNAYSSSKLYEQRTKNITTRRFWKKTFTLANLYCHLILD